MTVFLGQVVRTRDTGPSVNHSWLCKRDLGTNSMTSWKQMVFSLDDREKPVEMEWIMVRRTNDQSIGREMSSPCENTGTYSLIYCYDVLPISFSPFVIFSIGRISFCDL